MSAGLSAKSLWRATIANHSADGHTEAVEKLCATTGIRCGYSLLYGDLTRTPVLPLVDNHSGGPSAPAGVVPRARAGSGNLLWSRWRSSSVRQSKRLIIAVSPVQVRPPL